MKNIEELLHAIIDICKTTSDPLSEIMKLKRQYSKELGLAEVTTNTELLKTYRALLAAGGIERNEILEQQLKKRGVRSQSGIVPIQVLTKPFRCPGKCIFCPNDATMPKSYINTEPGAMRALLNQFDPYKQAYNRMLSLYLTGHSIEKIEMIVLGGTRDVYPTEYKRDFLKGLYDAANTFTAFLSQVDLTQGSRTVRYKLEDMDLAYPTTIEESMKINETAEHRIIGLTIETRPEYMTDENCQMRRSRGVTRLEMGLQSMFDDVLDANKRGHSVQQAREAVHKMRQYGFKFSIHFMPGLYGSTIEKDIESFRLAYSDPWLQPDEIKFYPTSVIPNTELYDLYQAGTYKPLSNEDIVHIIKKVQREIIPPYTRIKRLIRDIPATEIAAGSNITNLRQLVEIELLAENANDEALRMDMYRRLYPDAQCFATMDEMIVAFSSPHSGVRSANETSVYKTYILGHMPDISSMRKYVSLDTRAREMRHRTEGKPAYVNLVVREYPSSMGREYFISFEDELGYIYGFARLLLPEASLTIDRPGLGKETALIRELHVYGQVVGLLSKETGLENMAQHKGFGSQLMACAEAITAAQGYTRLSVISGIGVKEYYKKLGYSEEGTYVVKEL